MTDFRVNYGNGQVSGVFNRWPEAYGNEVVQVYVGGSADSPGEWVTATPQVMGQIGGSTRAKRLSKRRRVQIAAVASAANLARSERSRAATRLKQSESGRAAWARRKAAQK